MLRTLEVAPYKALKRHRSGWIAQRLGIPKEEEEQCLAVLERTHQIRWTGSHYQVAFVQAVDTRGQTSGAIALKSHWIEVGLDKLRRSEPGLYSFNVSAVSRADLEKLERLQRAHYKELTRVIAASERPECVVLYSAQLLPLVRGEI